MRRGIFEASAFDEFTGCADEDRKVHGRIVRLIREAQRTPFTGLGKPEPLRGPVQGYRSRRITDEHRLVHKVTDEAILIAACKNHYQ